MSPLAVPGRALSPPELSWESKAEERARFRRQDESYAIAFEQVLAGDGPFWAQIDQHRFDNAQEMFILAAVQMAIAGAADDAEFRQIIMQAVKREAGKYAEFVAAETA